MSTDYLDAATRHRRDAGILFERKRWPNADQLYGLAAECGLKAVMQALGMALRDDGAPEQKHHRVHIDRLWDAFGTFAEGRKAGRLAVLLGDNPFADWHVSQRYHATTTITGGTVLGHRRGTEQVFEVVAAARLDGRLP